MALETFAKKAVNRNTHTHRLCIMHYAFLCVDCLFFFGGQEIEIYKEKSFSMHYAYVTVIM